MKRLFNGEQVYVTEVDVLTAHEPWSEYQLSDGNVIKTKHVLKIVYKIDGKTNPDGSPVYGCEGQIVVSLKEVEK